MPILLLAIFLKGPAWLRAAVLAGFGMLLLFACASTAHTFSLAIERTPIAHAAHGRPHPALPVRF